MSIKLSIKELSKEDRKFITETLEISYDNGQIHIYETVKETTRFVLLPFSFGLSFVSDLKPELSLTSNTTFTGNLRPQQQQIRDLAFKKLTENRSVIISAKPGFGKTITAIEMICALNVPTIIFIKQVMIMNQWKAEIARFAPNKKISIVKSKCNINDSGDIYLVNPIILKNQFTYTDFERFKLLVVDELHQIVTKILHKAFFKIQPDYLIGLSATPYRSKLDPLKPAISWFFGEHVIGDKLFRNHTVYCLQTQFRPIIKKRCGKLDWSVVLNSQAQNYQRNKLIIDTIAKFPERTWLILVKRIDHAKTLQKLFNEKNIKSETIIGSSKSFDKSAKILIGTTLKVGVGFDHSPIDALCMAADVLEYFEQFLGRCMRRQDVQPIVIDFEDDFKPLKNHLSVRIQKYKECGGSIQWSIPGDDSNVNGAVGSTDKIIKSEIIIPKNFTL